MFRALVPLSLAACGRLGFDDAGTAVMPDGEVPDGIVELSNRGSSPCIRAGDGRVACWGANLFGQLGRGTQEAYGAPGLVAVPSAVRLATGEFTAFAIDRDGALWGWGRDDSGQLGLGATSPARPSPVRIPVGERVVDVAAGEYHTCAVTEAGGVACWGDNRCGQLGTGDVAPRLSPVAVPGLTDIARITVTDLMTCAIDTSSVPHCFGAAYSMNSSCTGQLVTPAPPANLARVRDLRGGCHYSLCGIDTDGAAWCAGDDVDGVLGTATPGPRATPDRVQLAGATAIATGYDVSCAVTGTELACWGSNTDGQLGIGDAQVTTSRTPRPVPYFAAIAIDELEVGCSTSCIRAGREIHCWGDNSATVIDDTTLDAYLPARRLGLPF